MAMRYIPNGGAGVRIVVIKQLMIYGPVSRSFLFPELQLWNRLCLLENMRFECDDFVVCHAELYVLFLGRSMKIQFVCCYLIE